MDWQSYYDNWKSFSREPGESESSTLERFAQTFGLDAPSKQALKDANPDQPVIQAVQEEPGFGTQIEAGLYETQKGFGEAIEGTAAGFLDDMGLTGLSNYAEQYGREVSADARQELQRFPDPQTREELEASDTFMGAIYRDFAPEGLMAPEELGRSFIPSLAPAGVALGAGLIAALAIPATKATILGIGAKTVFTGATSAAVGNLTGSFMVSGEEYESGKENPEIRQALEIDPNIPFKDLSPQEQQAVAESAQNVAKDTMVKRLYTSGALESLAFIPYGPLAIRYLADITLGATSEEIDRRLGASNVVDELVRLGVDESEIPELKERVLALRPSMRDTLLNAALMEGIAGAPVAITESVASRVLDPRIDKPASDSKLMTEMKQQARLESAEAGKRDRMQDLKDQLQRRKEAREQAKEAREEFKADQQAQLQTLKIEDQKIRNQKSALELKNTEGQTTGFQDQILPTRKRTLRERVSEVQKKTKKPKQTETALQRLQRQAQAGGEAKLAEDTRQQFETTTEERVTAQEFEKSEQREAESFEDQTAQSLQEDKYLREVAAEDKAFADSARREEEANLKQRQDMGLLSYSKRGDYVDGETPLMSAGQAKSVLKTIQSYFPKAKFKIAAKSLKGNLLDPESKEILATGEEVNSEGFVLNEMGDQTPVYLVPENLTQEYLGDDVNSAVDRMVEVAFHEYLGHYGLRKMFNAGKFNPEKGEFSGSRYNKFIKKFELKNRRKINAWAKGDQYGDASQFVKAEEYIARNFAEKGVPELGFLRSLAVDIRNAIPGGQFRLTEDQVIKVLQDVQKQYAGSDRSIVAGTSATAEVGKDQEEAPKISASMRMMPKTKSFKNWFGESKVVNEKGEPLVVYHGSPDFKGGSFKGSFTQTRDPGDFGEGFYFSKSPKDASMYASSSGSLLGGESKAKSAQVIPAFLSLKNPFNVENISNTDWDRIESAIGSPISKGFRNDVKGKSSINYIVPQMKGWARNIGGFKSMLEKAGYDGVIAGSEIVAYKPNQIKSTFNRGTFSKDTPNISQSRRPVDADPDRFRLNPKVQKINQDLAAGKIDKATQTVKVNKILGEPKPFQTVPEPSSTEQIKDALGKKWEKKFIVGDQGQDIKQGRRTSARLDINAYKFKNTWVPTIHDPKKNDQVIAYAPTSHLKNVQFHGRGNLSSYVGKALKVGLTGAKNPFAMYDGDWQQHNPDALKKRAESLLNDKDWTQIGMNPYRHSFFYDRSGGKRNGRPVVSASEVIQIGGMVLAKDVVYGNTGDFRTDFKGRNVSFSKRKIPLSKVGFAGVKGQDVIGRDIPVWPGSIVVHSTDQEGLADISKGGYRVVGDGYYGEAVSFTTNILYSKSFGGETTIAQLSDDIKILNDNDPKDSEKIRKIWGNRPDGRKMHQQMLDAGYDGVYDPGAGDLFIYNPAKVKMIGTPDEDFSGPQRGDRVVSFSKKLKEYQGVHHAPIRDDGAAMHELDKMYPDDIYSPMGARYYGHGGDDYMRDKAVHKIIMSARGKPDKRIKVYRAVPPGTKGGINPGDWVTPERQYALEHGLRYYDEPLILEKEVRAGDLFSEGNSLYEFGWSPLSASFSKRLAKASQDASKNEDFKRWFKKSKVTNEDGTPQPVYHGTMSIDDFDTFTDEEIGLYRGGLLAFFSEDPSFAEIYAGGDPLKGPDSFLEVDKGRIIPAFIRAEKPFDYLDTKAIKKVVKSYLKTGEVSKNHANQIEFLDNTGIINLGPKYANKAITPKMVNEEILTTAVESGAFEAMEDASFVEHIRDMGYDAIYMNEEGSRNLAVFTPQQIKSVFNKKPTEAPAISQSIRPGQAMEEGQFDPMTLRILSASLRPDVLNAIKDGKYIRIASDRFATGTYKPIDPANPYLKDFKMKGGVGYTLIPENREAGAMWASDDVGINSDIISKIKQGVRFGLTYLMGPDSHLSNRAFWKIYEGETQWGLDKGEIDLERLNARIQEMIDKGNADVKAWKEIGPKIAKAKGKDQWSKLKNAMNDMPYEQRKPVVKWLGGNPFVSGKEKYAVEAGLKSGAFSEKKASAAFGADLKEIYKRTTQNEAIRNAPYGATMSVTEFYSDFNGEPLRPDLTAKDFGVAEHEAYQYILPGKDIAVFEEPIHMDEAFDEWLVVRKNIARKGIDQFSKQYKLTDKDIKNLETAMDKIRKSPDHKTKDKAKEAADIFRGHYNALKAKTATDAKRALYLGGQPFTPSADVLKKGTELPPITDPNYLDHPTTKNFISSSLRRSTRGVTQSPGATGLLGKARALVAKIEPLSGIKNRELFLNLRRLTKGEIFRAEELGKKVYDTLKASTDTVALYKYFTTKGQSSSIIKNKTERAMAESAKKMIEASGQALVKAKLLKQSTLNEMEGEYLPRVYLKHLLNESDQRRLAQGMKADLSYLKKRKDIPAAIRDLILGEIKTQEGAPAYLASRAIMQPARDISLLNFLGKIASESLAKKLDWVLPQSLVEFNTLDELKKIAKGSGNLKKFLQELDLDDDFSGVGKMVTPHFLETEANRIQEQIFPILDKDKLQLANNLVTRMRKVASDGVDLTDAEVATIPKEYKQIPKQPRYGALAGMYTKKEIYDDVVGGFKMIRTGDESWAERVLGNTGAMGTFSRYWKWAKVSANPPSHVRNFISNLILMNLGGMPFWRMPQLFYQSIQDIRGDKGSYAIAKDMGLTATTFANVELGRIEREFKDLQVRMKKGGDQTPLKIYGMVSHVLGKGMDKVGDMYGFIDALGKTMMLKHQMENNKLSKEEGAALADKYLFDYSLVRPSTQYLRNTSAAPFVTFQTKVFPILLETMLTKPWKFAPYYAMTWGLAKMFKENHDLDDEQYDALLETLPEYLREKAQITKIPGTSIPIIPQNVVALPWLDDNNKIQFQDLSYLFPWGMFSEVASELSQGQFADAIKTVGLMGGPAINLTTALQTNIDPFSRREIINEFATPTEKATSVIDYVWNLSSPPMFHTDFGAVKRVYESFTGAKTREGEVRFTPGQGALRAVGQNITPIDPVEGRRKNLRFMQSRLAKLVAERNRRLRDMRNMDKSAEDIKEEREDYREKIDKLRNEIREYRKASRVPQQFRRAG